MHTSKTGYVGAIPPLRSARIANHLVVIAYVVYAFCSMFQFMTLKLEDIPCIGETIATCYEPVTLSMLVVAIAIRKWRWGLPGLLGLAGLACVYFLSASLSFARSLAILLLFLLAIGDLDHGDIGFTTFVKASFWTSVGILVVSLVWIALFGGSQFWDILDGGYISGRGISHPNAYSILVFNVMLCVTFLVDRKRFFVPVLICIGLCTAFVYFIQRSDTTAMLSVLLMVVIVLERLCPRLRALFSKPIVFSASLSIIACVFAVFMIVAAAAYSTDNGLLVAADRLLHGRIALPSAVLREYGGYSVLGRPFDIWTGSMHTSRMLGVPTVMLDSSYIRYALINGLLSVACTWALFSRSVRNIGMRNPSLFLWGVFLIMLAYMIMELYPSNLCLNCTLPLLTYGLLPERDVEGLRAAKDVGTYGEE